MKASAVVGPTKVAKEKPDLEEAIEESDEGEVVEDPDAKKNEDEEGDITKDKYIKQPKKKAGPKKKAKAKAAADDDEEEERPKKGKGKSRAKK